MATTGENDGKILAASLIYRGKVGSREGNEAVIYNRDQ